MNALYLSFGKMGYGYPQCKPFPPAFQCLQSCQERECHFYTERSHISTLLTFLIGEIKVQFTKSKIGISIYFIITVILICCEVVRLMRSQVSVFHNIQRLIDKRRLSCNAHKYYALCCIPGINIMIHVNYISIKNRGNDGEDSKVDKINTLLRKYTCHKSQPFPFSSLRISQNKSINFQKDERL